MTRTEKRIEWTERIDAWKASGLSTAAWCSERGIKKSQMYYWIRSFKEDKSLDTATDRQWLSVDIKEQSLNFRSGDPVLIHFDSMSIEVREGTDLALLADVMVVLRNRC